MKTTCRQSVIGTYKQYIHGLHCSWRFALRPQAAILKILASYMRDLLSSRNCDMLYEWWSKSLIFMPLCVPVYFNRDNWNLSWASWSPLLCVWMQAVVSDGLKNIYSTLYMVHKVRKKGKHSPAKYFKLVLEHSMSWHYMLNTACGVA